MSTRYQIVATGGVRDLETGEVILPNWPGWREYHAWLEQGNDPLPAESPPPDQG